MVFYLEAADIPELNTFRLQRDLSWVACASVEPLSDEDYFSISPENLIPPVKTKISFEYNGKVWYVNEKEIVDYSTREKLYYTIKVKRVLFPKLPSEDQLISTIRQGDDRKANRLVLNVFGFFELRYAECVEFIDPTIVVRFETFNAQHDYVGESAALDTRHIRRLYNSGLEYWLKHLHSGVTCFYCDIEGTISQSEVLRQIAEMETEINRMRENYYENGDEFQSGSFVSSFPEYE